MCSTRWLSTSASVVTQPVNKHPSLAEKFLARSPERAKEEKSHFDLAKIGPRGAYPGAAPGRRPCTAEARARRRTTLALHKPAQVHPGQPQRPQLGGNGRVFDELTIAANSSSTHVPRLGRRSSCPLLRLTGYPPQQRDGTYLGGSPTPQVRPLLTISARAGGAYDAGRSSKNLHATRGNSAAAFLARC